VIIDSHLHVWIDDQQRYPFADGREDAAPGSTELLIETMEAAGSGDAPQKLETLVARDGFSGLTIHPSRPDDPSEWAGILK
tara:strand:- start:345 stop:587 length:243 start_codon:yes stop_codon:yes gene_type:complete